MPDFDLGLELLELMREWVDAFGTEKPKGRNVSVVAKKLPPIPPEGFGHIPERREALEQLRPVVAELRAFRSSMTSALMPTPEAYETALQRLAERWNGPVDNGGWRSVATVCETCCVMLPARFDAKRGKPSTRCRKHAVAINDANKNKGGSR